jgi:hypothetical protein
VTVGTPRQRIESPLRTVCTGLALERFTTLDEMSTGELSSLETYGLECFRLGMEYEREKSARAVAPNSQRPTQPAPAPEDDDDR